MGVGIGDLASCRHRPLLCDCYSLAHFAVSPTLGLFSVIKPLPPYVDE